MFFYLTRFLQEQRSGFLLPTTTTTKSDYTEGNENEVTTNNPDNDSASEIKEDGTSNYQIKSTPDIVSALSEDRIKFTPDTPEIVSVLSEGRIKFTPSTPDIVSVLSEGQIKSNLDTPEIVPVLSEGQVKFTPGTPDIVSVLSEVQIKSTSGTPEFL